MDACTGDDGSVYALPLSVDTRVIYYNKAQFEEAGMKCAGENPETGLVEVVEIPALKWFVGVQFHPEYNSTVVNPNPLFVSFVKAAIDNK